MYNYCKKDIITKCNLYFMIQCSKAKGFHNLKLYLLLLFSLFTFLFSHTTVSHAAHPLVTDDTGTQGKGKFQVEVNSEFTHDKENENSVDGSKYTVKSKGGEITTVLTYGALDNLDVFIEVPYRWNKIKINGVVPDGDPSADAKGISDISIGMKWRFYDHEGLSFGLKPTISMPTGKEDKGLGNGKPSYEILFLITKEFDPWAVHLNIGYAHNEYKLESDKESKRKGILKASLAGEVMVAKGFKFVADTGIERNEEKAKNNHPAFILGGLIYSVTEKLDISLGVKAGLNKAETDLTILAGLAIRF